MLYNKKPLVQSVVEPIDTNVYWVQVIPNSTDIPIIKTFHNGTWTPLTGTPASIQDLLDLKAPLESPAFTGTPTINGLTIPTSDLNGTDYVMVYGIGTPLENGIEFKNAYDSITSGTLIYAPGTYEFSSTFVHNKDNVNIVSLTGNRDGIFVFNSFIYSFSIVANNTFIKGISTSSTISIGTGINGLRMENCQGGSNSFSCLNGDLGGHFYKCDAIGHGFKFLNVHNSLVCIDCTATYGFSSEEQGGGYMGYECLFIRCEANYSGGHFSFSIGDFNNFNGETPKYISCVSDSFDNPNTLKHPRVVSYCFNRYYIPVANVEL